LELARYFSSNNEKEPYNLLFIAFGAEELGLVGSKYFTEHPTLPLEKITAMLNMDMIGRYNPSNGLCCNRLRNK
jgi:Zn-dependent M28 family amino/carboxypeptidase